MKTQEIRIDRLLSDSDPAESVSAAPADRSRNDFRSMVLLSLGIHAVILLAGVTWLLPERIPEAEKVYTVTFEAGQPVMHSRQQSRKKTSSEKSEPSSSPDNNTETASDPEAVRAAVRTYEELIASLLEKNKVYPLAARRLKIQGNAVLQLRISRDGSIQEMKLISSSGHDLLDEAVHTMVKRTGSFPPFPETINASSQIFTVPVSFRLTAD